MAQVWRMVHHCFSCLHAWNCSSVVCSAGLSLSDDRDQDWRHCSSTNDSSWWIHRLCSLQSVSLVCAGLDRTVG